MRHCSVHDSTLCIFDHPLEYLWATSCSFSLSHSFQRFKALPLHCSSSSRVNLSDVHDLRCYPSTLCIVCCTRVVPGEDQDEGEVKAPEEWDDWDKDFAAIPTKPRRATTWDTTDRVPVAPLEKGPSSRSQFPGRRSQPLSAR